MANDFYTRICSGIIFPLHEWIKKHHTTSVRKELETTQWWSAEQIQALQITRLRHLLVHAGKDVPYYRDLFSSIKFDPHTVNSLGDLSRLPILTKDIIRREGDRIKSPSAQHLKRFSTTGSSGDPLQFYIGKDRVTHDVAAKWRATRWWDVDIGDPEMVAWSSPIELNTQDRIKQIRDRLLRTRLLSTHSLSPERTDRFLEEIIAFRPRMLFGYPSSLTLLAQRAEDRGIDMSKLGIKVAFVTAERSYPHQRDIISRVFKCPVADGYGGRDAGFIAHECPAGGRHITAEDIIVEVVDAEGNPLLEGQAGEVVVTQLFTHDFPFVRYKNGDVATLSAEKCSCGRGLPLIKEVQGRTNDFLITQEGGRVHDVAFAMVLRDTPGVKQFKIIQETLALVRLQLVTDKNFNEAVQRPKIEQTFRFHLGKDLQLNIEFVTEIAPEKSGKYRYVVTHVTQ
jgi:phenylacetate-CoA ligase